MLDLNLLKNIMSEIRENDDLLDSLSPNQFATKLKLVEHVDKLDFLNESIKVSKIPSSSNKSHIALDASFSPNIAQILDTILEKPWAFDF